MAREETDLARAMQPPVSSFNAFKVKLISSGRPPCAPNANFLGSIGEKDGSP